MFLTEKNRLMFKEALKPTYRDAIGRLLGEDFLRKVEQTSDDAELPIVPADLVKL